MTITGKSIGRKKPLFDGWSIPLPPDWVGEGDGGRTLRELIEQIVRDEVAAFQTRQYDRQFVHALTARAIDEAAERGKIDMGGSEVGIQKVDVDESVGTALQAFEDGLYMVVIDDVEQRSLDQQVFVSEESRVTFIRLTMLSGG